MLCAYRVCKREEESGRVAVDSELAALGGLRQARCLQLIQALAAHGAGEEEGYHSNTSNHGYLVDYMGSLTQVGRFYSLESGAGAVHRQCWEVPCSDEIQAALEEFCTVIVL